jgi:hypothetical protein
MRDATPPFRDSSNASSASSPETVLAVIEVITPPLCSCVATWSRIAAVVLAATRSPICLLRIQSVNPKSWCQSNQEIQALAVADSGQSIARKAGKQAALLVSRFVTVPLAVSLDSELRVTASQATLTACIKLIHIVQVLLTAAPPPRPRACESTPPFAAVAATHWTTV